MKTALPQLKYFIIILILSIGMKALGQQGINYQGVARDGNNDIMVNADITLGIGISTTSEGETIVYSETHDTTTDANGVFSIVIGEGSPTFNDFADINWAESQHYLRTFLNGEQVGVTEFMATPYTKAIGNWQAHKNGLTVKGTGGSIFVGDNTGQNDDLTDNNNIGFGNEVLATNTTGMHNIALGELALNLNRGGYYNIAMGRESLTGNTVGNNNTGIGFRSLKTNTTGSDNIAIGTDVLYSNTTGTKNISLGIQSMQNNTIGNYNLAAGAYALYANTEGSENIALGNRALFYNTTGTYNIALGHRSLIDNTSGNYNVAMGYMAVGDNTTGDYNIGLGYRSLRSNTTGNNNIALGQDALYNTTTGWSNIAIGYSALTANVTEISNIAIGTGTLSAHNDGNNNVALGSSALNDHTTGSGNVAIGGNTLSLNVTGIDNTAIGYRAGGDNLGSGNVFIGAFAGTHSNFNNVSNTLIIDRYSHSNPLIYGEFDNDILAFNAKVGIGTVEPVSPLQIKGGTDTSLSLNSGQIILGEETSSNLSLDNNEIQARNNGVAAILYLQQSGGDVYVGNALVHASDKRLKRDIENISYGLETILKLRPTEYFWKDKTQEYKSLGLIAQEVDEVIKNVVTYDKELDRYGVSYTELIPVLIKALQEQQEIINTQNNTLKSFEARLEALENTLGE